MKGWIVVARGGGYGCTRWWRGGDEDMHRLANWCCKCVLRGWHRLCNRCLSIEGDDTGYDTSVCVCVFVFLLFFNFFYNFCLKFNCIFFLNLIL